MNAIRNLTFSDPAQTWNRCFAGEQYFFGTAPNIWLREHAHVWQGGRRVLRAADGEGRNSVWPAGQGLRVDAFDIAPAGVDKARRLAAANGAVVSYAVMDCDACLWPEAAYGGVAAIFVQFANPAMRKRLFTNMVGTLKRGGTRVLQGYTPRQLKCRTGGPLVRPHLYTKSLLRTAFLAMQILELCEYKADVAAGSGHKGRSALIGVAAQRR